MSETLALHISNYCQNKCVFCMERKKNGERIKHKIYSLDEYKKIVQSGIKRIPDLDRVFLAGGEPTFNKNFLKLVDKLFKLGLKIDTVSNGGLFKNLGFCNEFSNNGGNAIHLSLHSHNKITHNNICGNKEAYKNSITSIENILKSNIKLYINFIVNRLNCNEIYDFVSWINLNYPEIYMISFYLCRPVGVASGNNNIISPITKIANNIDKALNMGSKVRIIIRDIPTCVFSSQKAVIRFQKFFIYKHGNFVRLSTGKYKKKFKCLFCNNSDCEGFLKNYPKDKYLL